MQEPLKQFYCDTCGRIIEDPSKGTLAWISNKDATGTFICDDFHICHKNNNCRPHRECDVELIHLAEGKGLNLLLSKIDCGIYFNQSYLKPGVGNFRSFTEILRRLYLPYYEEARQYFVRAKKSDEFGDVNEVDFFDPENMKRIIIQYSDNTSPR